MQYNMWTFNNEALNNLSSLMAIVSPSMEEIDMATFLRKYWQENHLEVETDVLGNLYSCQKGTKDINIAICSHMDTVAIQITRILPNGMLQFRRIGLNPHVLLGQRLKIKTANGLIDGVVGFDPTSQYGQPKGLIEEDLWIDIYAKSQAEAEEIVDVGDLAVINYGLMPTMNDYLCGSSLDNRIGLFILNECVKVFANNKIPVNLHFIATAQEEVGLRGSSVIAAQNKYDACIVIDVDYATDTLTPHDNQMGVLKLGKGVGLQKKADNNSVLRRIAIEVANQKNIPYQVSLGRFLYGGTDSSTIQLTGRGVATLNLNIPCRYMHSPIETCHKKDVEAAINLLIGIIDQIGRKNISTFIPGLD